MLNFSNVSIETNHFILTPHRVSDFSESAVMWADPLVSRYTTGYALTREDAWFRLLRNIGHWQAMQYGHWVIREKATGVFVGEGGFSDYKRDIGTPHYHFQPEVSLALAPLFHHKGFSIEILRGILAWGDQFISSKEVMCLIYPDNIPAIRVARHLGFAEETEVMYKQEKNLMFIRR